MKQPAPQTVPDLNPPPIRRFASPAVAALFNDVREISHPEHPFLDRVYSPGSCMPAADFSPWVATMHGRRDQGSIDELLSYLADPMRAKVVRTAMAGVDLRRFIRADDALLHEIWAILLLGHRYYDAGHESSRTALIREILAHSLACWRFELVEGAVPHLLEGANKFLRKRNREGVFGEEPLLDPAYLARLDVPEVSPVGESLRRFPVTFRTCIAYSIQRGSPVVGCIRPQLDGHYGLRQFGLSSELNRGYFASADFFQPPDDLGALGGRMKKDELSAIAAAAGISVRKSAKKDEMVALLMGDAKARELLGKAGAGELVQVAPGLRGAFDQWHLRAKGLEKIALCLSCA